MEANTADFVLTAPANAPWFLHLGAAILLYAHIIGASVGMVAGTIAILSRKGGRLHRAAGNVFFVAMLVMTGVAAAVAPFLGEAQWTNTTAAVFTLYLVATGWATIKREPGRIGRFEVAAFVAALAMAGTGLAQYLLNAGTPRASALATVYVFAIVAAIAALCDFGVILGKGISGGRRIARHAWRMSLALVVALGSFFLGQQDELPAFVQGSPFLAAPMLIALGLMAFWLIRARFTKAFQPARAPARAT